MVPKPSDPLGGLRYVVDYRYLNKFTIADSSVIPRVDDLLDSLAGAEVFSMMDCAAGFWGVEIKPEHRHLTAFNTWTHGQCEFVRMPFGLRNAPSCFSRAMTSILHPHVVDTYLPKSLSRDHTISSANAAGAGGGAASVQTFQVTKRIASLYIDDVCVHGKRDSHVDNLASVLKRLHGNNVSLKMVKCEFAVTEGKFLGHVVKAGEGVMADPKKVSAIVQMQRPRTVGDIRTLLGACSYLRRFIADFSDVTLPLRLIQKNYRNKNCEVPDADWLPEHEAAFRALQAALSSAPVLAFPDFDKPMIVCCDASGTQLGAVLCQRDKDGIERPIAYGSKALNSAERKYAISDLEGAAVVWAMKMWRPYLLGSKCLCITDHRSLCYLLTKHNLRSARQERYAMDLMEFDIAVVHRPGELNVLPDCLSRAGIEHNEDKLLEELASLTELQGKQLRDGKFEPGSELAKWQTILGGRGKGSVEELDGFDRRWCEQTKLQCLIRGASISEDDHCEDIESKLEALAREHVEITPVQGSDEYCRATEMYGYVAASITSTVAAATRSKTKPKAGQGLGGFTDMHRAGSPARAAKPSTETLSKLRSKVHKLKAKVDQQLKDSIQTGAEELAQRTALGKAAPAEPLCRESLLAKQHADPELQKIRRTLQGALGATGFPLTLAQQSQLHQVIKRDYAIDPDGMIVRLLHGRHQGIQKVVVVPECMVQAALFSCHEGNAQGHPGALRTYQKAQDSFYWRGMYTDVYDYVKSCAVCQMHSRAPSEAPIAGHITASRPGEGWVADVLHMEESSEGHVGVLVAVDVFSRFAILMPMYTIDSEEVCELLKLHVVGNTGGVPAWILSDNGAEFKGEFKELCTHFGIEHKTSAPGHSQSHGMVERLIATTELTLAHFIDDDGDTWHKILAHAQLTHNSAPHPALSVGTNLCYTPAEVYLGRKLRTRLSRVLLTDFEEEVFDVVGYVEYLQSMLPRVKVFVQDSQERYHKRMENTARNRRRKLRAVQVGSLVKLYKRPRDKKKAKLYQTWQGPYRVVKITSDGANVDLKHVASSEVLGNQNINHVALYHEGTNVAVPESDRVDPKYSGAAYQVIKIVDDKGNRGVDKHYLVRWKGDYADTWEPEGNLECPKLVQAYYRRKARKAPVVAAAHDHPKAHSSHAWAMTVSMNLLHVDPLDLTADICRQAGIQPEDVAAKIGFVPCETYSIADLSNVTRGHHYRDHTKAHKPPRRDTGKKRDTALAHDTLVSNIPQAWACDAEQGSNAELLLENPVDNLQHRPFMHDLPAALGMIKHRIDYCAYNHIFKKPAHIWTTLDWSPTGRTGNGRCCGQCGQGSIRENGRFKHFHGLAQEPIRGPRGPGATKLKNAVPGELCDEWLQVMLDRRKAVPHQNTIIDLCAGFQSIKPWALKHGFNYIAVDVMGDRNRRRKLAAAA